MAKEAARIRIRRSRAFCGALRRLLVRIDGKKVYRLKRGELAILTVAPGEHTIQVQMDWCKTAPFPVACPKSETIELECGSGPFWSAIPGIVLRPDRVFFVGLGREGQQYEHTLLAMKRLLDAVGEKHWADWINQDIEDWRSNRCTSHHLSAYGTMGSLTDVLLCRANQHNISESQEPWVNTLFSLLLSLCYDFAQHPLDSPGAKLPKAVTRCGSALVALVGEDQELEGWRCRRCGHAEVSHRGIEWMIARNVVPTLLLHSRARATLNALVDRVLACDIEGVDSIRQDVGRVVTASGMTLIDREGWMQPCPTCGTEDTAVYRWKMTARDGLSFQPSDKNLPMRD